MKRQNYAVEYKLKAVELLRASGRTKTAVAKELGVSDSTLCKWVVQYESGQLSDKGHNSDNIAENKLNREFKVNKPNQVWVTDITYIKTITGWVYLALVLDLFSKQVVGYQTSSSIDNKLVLDALNKALFRRRPEHGLLFHSDRGVQFASHDFKKAIADASFIQSMSRKANCWDNTPAESFFAT